MDGRLWTELYREIRRACKGEVRSGRVGRPRVYGTDEILLVWAFAAMNDWPISVAREKLASGATGWWLQRHWADNAVSVTIYYHPSELPGIREYLEDNWRYFKSLSFLRHSDHGFDQAPMEAITWDEYHTRLNALGHEHVDVHGLALDLEDSDCATGSCPVR